MTHKQLWPNAPYWTDSTVPVYTPLDEVEWRQVGVIRTGNSYDYQLSLPRPLADWDAWDDWERERFTSMRQHLKPDMTLFDVGSEAGWISTIYAGFVGPENMVLIEPTPEFWPNIKATWERNLSAPPKACYTGLISTETTTDETVFEPWPAYCDGPLIDRNKYTYLHETISVPQIRLDDLAERVAAPQAITIDVEGAELSVLQGASETLREHRPLVWCSVHPDLMLRDYDSVPGELHAFMQSLGYRRTFLAEDHEQHFYYEPL